MGNFTYEDKKSKNQLLETYEWDNIWWEHAPDKNKKRALIIGDSISCGYRSIVNKMLDGEIYADGFGTSKAVDNPFFVKSLELMLEQSNCSLILFNNGLHGYHLNAEDYKENYRNIIKALLEKYPDKKLALILTTPTREDNNLAALDAHRNEIACARNTAAKEIASEFNLDVIDLYSALIDEPGTLWCDPFHIKEQGCEKLAKIVSDYIKNNA